MVIGGRWQVWGGRVRENKWKGEGEGQKTYKTFVLFLERGHFGKKKKERNWLKLDILDKKIYN